MRVREKDTISIIFPLVMTESRICLFIIMNTPFNWKLYSTSTIIWKTYAELLFILGFWSFKIYQTFMARSNQLNNHLINIRWLLKSVFNAIDNVCMWRKRVIISFCVVRMCLWHMVVTGCVRAFLTINGQSVTLDV